MQKNADGGKQKQAVSLNSNQYYDVQKNKLKCVKAAKKHGPRAMFETDDALSEFAWVVVRDTLLYSAWLMPEIADDILDVDAALRGGYNAHWGPFEIIDQLGIEWFCNRVKADGISLPPILELADNRSFYREQHGKSQRLVFDFQNRKADYADIPARDGVLKLTDIKRGSKPLVSHYSASLWDIGDGVTCLEFHSKMNTLDPSILWVVNHSIHWMNEHRSQYRAMVIYNEAKNFSLGANIGLLAAGFQAASLPAVKALGLTGILEHGIFSAIEAMIFHGQSVFNALRNAPFPVVGAPNGMALGGGCEILLHCNALQASSETYMGLVESGVGLIPAWGGCTRFLERAQNAPNIQGGSVPPVRLAFQTIMMPQFSVSTSAQDARHKLWLNPDDGITMNPDRILFDAKQRALNMVEMFTPPQPIQYRLPGSSGKSALNMAIDDFYHKGEATYHDVVVADALSIVLTGGNTDSASLVQESELIRLERENFLSLLKTKQTRKRIAHTLKTGKPLREDPLSEPKALDEIRSVRKSVNLPNRPLNGFPLTGSDATTLRIMAEVTAILLKKFAG
jgi:3-hydroxyacyl-CoA dehydrogenase